MTSVKGVDNRINTLIQRKVLKKGFFNYGQDMVMVFSTPVVDCLDKRDLQKGEGSRAPQDPLATTMPLTNKQTRKIKYTCEAGYMYMNLSFLVYFYCSKSIKVI